MHSGCLSMRAGKIPLEGQFFYDTEITRRVFTFMSNSAARAISLQFSACNCLAWTLVFPKLLKIQPFVWNGGTRPG